MISLPWRPRAGAAARDRGPATARNALIAGALLLLALVFLTQFFTGGFAEKPPMERYVKMGPRQGARELERVLLERYPPGSNIGAIFEDLSRMGFDCGRSADPARGGECRFRARRGESQVMTAVVDVRNDGAQVQAIAVEMSVAGF